MVEKERDEAPKKGSLFDDLSATQVIAGALAAVTSMLLASQIGIAGSVIGVGVGSVVSAVASQLYKKFLAASAEKLRDLGPVESASGIIGGQGERETDPVEKPARKEQVETARIFSAKALSPDETQRTGELPAAPAKDQAADKTAVLNPVTVRQSNTLCLDDEALQGDATVLRAKTLRRRKKQLQRRVAAVAAVSALVAVMVSAFLINALTDGQGIGTKVSPLSSSITQSQSTDEAAGSDPSSGGSASGSGSNQGKGDAPVDDAGKNDGSSESTGGGSSGSADGGKPDGSGNPSDPSDGGGQGSSGGSDTGSGTGGAGGDGTQGPGSSAGTGTGSGSGTGTGTGTGSAGGQDAGSGSSSG